MEYGYVVFLKKNGDSTPIPVKDDVLVGRALHCGIRVHNNTVSQEHCLIVVKRGERACLRNLSSSYLTLVNGVSISNREYKLHHGDTVAVGKRSFLWMYPKGTSFHKEERAQSKLRRKSEADCGKTTVKSLYHKRRTLDPTVAPLFMNRDLLNIKASSAGKTSARKNTSKQGSPSLGKKSPNASKSLLEVSKYPTPIRTRKSTTRTSMSKSHKESKSPPTRVRKRSLSSPPAVPAKKLKIESPKSNGKTMDKTPRRVAPVGPKSSTQKKKTPSVSVRKLSAWGAGGSTKKRPLFSEVLKRKAVLRANSSKKTSQHLKIVPRKGAAKKFAEEIPKAFRFNSTGHANSPEPIFIGRKVVRTPARARTVNGEAAVLKECSTLTSSPSALLKMSPCKTQVKSPQPLVKTLVTLPTSSSQSPSFPAKLEVKASLPPMVRKTPATLSVKSPSSLIVSYSPSPRGKLLAKSPSFPASTSLRISLRQSMRKTPVKSPTRFCSPQAAQEICTDFSSRSSPLAKISATPMAQSDQKTPIKSQARSCTRQSIKRTPVTSTLKSASPQSSTARSLHKLSLVSSPRETKSSSPHSSSIEFKYVNTQSSPVQNCNFVMHSPSHKAARMAGGAVDSQENHSCIQSPFTSTPSAVCKRVSCISAFDSSRLDTPLSILTGHSSAAHTPASGRKSRMGMVSHSALNNSLSPQRTPVKSSLKESPSKSESGGSRSKNLSVSFSDNVDMQTFDSQSKVRRSMRGLCSSFPQHSYSSSNFMGSPDLESTTFDFNGAKTPNVPREMFVSSILSSGSSVGGQALGSAKRKGKGQKSPSMDSLSGVRQLMKSPAASGGYVDVKGVKRLLALPPKTPTYLAVEGVNRLFKRQCESFTKNSLTDIAGLRELFASQSPPIGSPLKFASQISPTRIPQILQSSSATPVAKSHSEVEGKENLNASSHSSHSSGKATPKRGTRMNPELSTEASLPERDAPLAKHPLKMNATVETSPQKPSPVRETQRVGVLNNAPFTKPVPSKTSDVSGEGANPVRCTRRGTSKKLASPVTLSPQHEKEMSSTKEPSPGKAGCLRRTRRNTSKEQQKQAAPQKSKAASKLSPVERSIFGTQTAKARKYPRRLVHFEDEEVPDTEVARRGKHKVEEQVPEPVHNSPVKKRRRDQTSPLPLEEANPKKTAKGKNKHEVATERVDDSPPPLKKTRGRRGAVLPTGETLDKITTKQSKPKQTTKGKRTGEVTTEREDSPTQLKRTRAHRRGVVHVDEGLDKIATKEAKPKKTTKSKGTGETYSKEEDYSPPLKRTRAHRGAVYQIDESAVDASGKTEGLEKKIARTSEPSPVSKSSRAGSAAVLSTSPIKTRGRKRTEQNSSPSKAVSPRKTRSRRN